MSKRCKYRIEDDSLFDKRCDQQIMPSPDYSQPSIRTLHPRSRNEAGMIVSYPLTIYGDYCFYHQKKKEGLIDGTARYPHPNRLWNRDRNDLSG